MANRQEGDLIITGNLMVGSMDVPANSVGDAQIKPNDPITCPKLNHQYTPLYSQARASVVAAGREVIHVAQGVGEILTFQALLSNVVNLAGATITVTLYKNGASITGTPASITDADALFTLKDGTLSATDYVAGDVFEVGVTVAAGGGTVGKGLVVRTVFREAAE